MNTSLRYNMHEYEDELVPKFGKFRERVGNVKAVDVERVAFVIMTEGEEGEKKGSKKGETPPGKQEDAM